MSKRAAAKLIEVREEFGWVDERRTTVVRQPGGSLLWWTFGGLGANGALAAQLRSSSISAADPDNLAIPIRDTSDVSRMDAAIESLAESDVTHMVAAVNESAIDELKFSTCLPAQFATRMLERRLTDGAAIRAVLNEPVAFVNEAADR